MTISKITTTVNFAEINDRPQKIFHNVPFIVDHTVPLWYDLEPESIDFNSYRAKIIKNGEVIKTLLCCEGNSRFPNADAILIIKVSIIAPDNSQHDSLVLYIKDMKTGEASIYI